MIQGVGLHDDLEAALRRNGRALRLANLHSVLPWSQRRRSKSQRPRRRVGQRMQPFLVVLQGALVALLEKRGPAKHRSPVIGSKGAVYAYAVHPGESWRRIGVERKLRMRSGRACHREVCLQDFPTLKDVRVLNQVGNAEWLARHELNAPFASCDSPGRVSGLGQQSIPARQQLDAGGPIDRAGQVGGVAAIRGCRKRQPIATRHAFHCQRGCRHNCALGWRNEGHHGCTERGRRPWQDLFRDRAFIIGHADDRRETPGHAYASHSAGALRTRAVAEIPLHEPHRAVSIIGGETVNERLRQRGEVRRPQRRSESGRRVGGGLGKEHQVVRTDHHLPADATEVAHLQARLC